MITLNKSNKTNIKSNTKTIIFIDRAVDNYQQLVAGAVAGAKVVILEPNRDGIEQITEFLSYSPQPEAIHLLCHGSPGCLYLGNNQLSLDTLDDYTPQLKRWFTPSIQNPKSLLLYGCNVAAGDAGEALITRLHHLTGANIAASAQLTGNAAAGGDWEMEVTTGKIETPLAIVPEVREAYAGLLATFTINTLVDENDGISLFDPNETPDTIVTDTTDTTDYELGVKFQSSQTGQITALQYFRGVVDANDTDIRTLNLWESDGDLLASVTVTSEVDATGWQVGALDTPVILQANTTYIASYGTTQNYAFTGGYFTSAHTSPDPILTAPASGTVGGNGVFNFTQGPGFFPTGSFNASNYWVDVIFEPLAGPNTPPQFISSATFVSLENQTLVGTVAATDADGNPLTFAIAGGVDAELFTINATTGLLEFKNPRDYEGGGTQFNMIVSVSDSIAPAVTQAVTVNLVDVDETPDGPANFIGSTLTAEYIFGTTPDTLFDGTGAIQTATVGSNIELPEPTERRNGCRQRAFRTDDGGCRRADDPHRVPTRRDAVLGLPALCHGGRWQSVQRYPHLGHDRRTADHSQCLDHRAGGLHQPDRYAAGSDRVRPDGHP
jgi:hypothetical protein